MLNMTNMLPFAKMASDAQLRAWLDCYEYVTVMNPPRDEDDPETAAVMKRLMRLADEVGTDVVFVLNPSALGTTSPAS